MFRRCESLRKLNIINFKFNKNVEIEGIIQGCKSLETLICSDIIRNKINGK